MKHLILSSIIAATLAASHSAMADQTITLGYAQSKVQHLSDIKGANVKYRVEWDSPVSFIGSVSYMAGTHDEEQVMVKDIIKGSADMKYFSITAGPAYRANEFVSVYGLVGLNVGKIDYSGTWYNYESYKGLVPYAFGSKETNTNLAYGAGIQINPSKNLAIDLSYEGSQMKFGDVNYKTNGFNVGVGYRF